jgi:hypothetical protein
MYYYAILNAATHVCEEVIQLEEELTDYNVNEYIPLSSYDTSVVGKVYNFETQQFEDASETANCTMLAEKVSIGNRRLDLFIGDETGLSIGDNTPNNLVAAINQVFQSASDGKTAIANAITGVDDSITIPSNPTFSELASAIGQISTGLQVATGSMNEYTIQSTIEGTTTFRPKIVIVYNFGTGLSNFNMGVYVSPDITGVTTHQISDSANGIGNTLSRRANAFTITDTGFSMINTGAATDLKWIALG